MPRRGTLTWQNLYRARSGRLYGRPVYSLTDLKGLPMTYNRDLQEEKELSLTPRSV
jgi:argininosuccinate lyase